MVCKVLRVKQLMLALWALALAACSQSDDVVDPSEPAAEFGPEVTFCAGMGSEARAASVDNSSFGDHPGWGIGIYGYFTGQTDWSEYLEASPDPDFMNDQYAGYDSGYWSYDPVKFWPNINGGKLSFIAYYPKLASSGSATSASTNSYGLPQIDVDITSDGSNITTESMFDLLVSEPAVNLTKEGGQVKLSMRHAMSRLTFCARHLADGADENLRVFIESVAIKATSESNLYKSATYSWTKVDGEAKGGWTNHSKCDAGTTISLESVLNTASPSLGTYNTPSVMLNTDGTRTPLLKNGEWLMFIPTGEKCLDAMAEIKYSVVNSLTGLVSEVTVDVPIDELQLKEGETHTLCFTIGGDKFSLKSLSRAGANCYMINQADIDKGYIVVPLSQVEDALKVVDNLDGGNAAMTAYTAAIASYENMTVETLWADGSGSVTGTVLEEDGKYYAKLDVSGLSLGQNIVVKLTDGASTTLWSWHLWVTDYDLGATPANGAIYQLNTAAFTSGGLAGKYMMDRNLGATVTGFSGYYADVAAGTDDGTNLYFGLKYQYGRKDPFENKNPTKVNNTASLFTSVNNPGTFYNNADSNDEYYYWCNYDYNNTAGNLNLWDLDNNYTKSPFDPCPAGWRVPSNKVAAQYNPYYGLDATSGATYTLFPWESTTGKHGRYATLTASGQGWFPAAGCLYYENGNFSSAGYYGNCWLSSLNGGEAQYLYFISSSVSPQGSYSRSGGCSVRCVQE